jgi:sugar O-acyltransferase (sialic acid O-acetyltransferase NeuD family)
VSAAARVVLVGAAGHALDVAEVAHRAGWRIEHLLVDPDHLPGVTWPRPVRTPIGPADLPYLVGVGYPVPRASVVERLQGGAGPAGPLVDPTAVVARTAELEPGVVVLWHAGVSPGCALHAHSSVSYGATVGHGTVVGLCSAVMPGAAVSGDVTLGREVLVGAGAVVLEGRSVGDGAVIGAGAVVDRDVPAGARAVGVPARWDR